MLTAFNIMRGGVTFSLHKEYTITSSQQVRNVKEIHKKIYNTYFDNKNMSRKKYILQNILLKN